MGANKSILGVLEGMAPAAIAVHQERCAKVRNRNVECLKCADACTSGCIALVDGELTVDASKCVGCGTCATVCPTCALEARNPSDAELLQACLRARSEGEVAIACEPLRRAAEGVLDGSRVADVVCLGRVDESLTSGLAAEGVRRIRLLCGDCSQCEQEHGAATARLVAETSNALFAAWGSDARVSVEEGVPACARVATADASQVEQAVEAYFSVKRGCMVVGADARAAADAVVASGAGDDDAGAVPGTGDEAAGAVPGAAASAVEISGPSASLATDGTALNPALLRVMKDGTLPHFVPDRREALLDNLAVLGEPVGGSVATRLWGCVIIDGHACSSCRMCATFCPTGAIRKFDNDDGTFGVDHFPGDCVQCGSCRDVCPEDAIRLLDEVKPSYLLGGEMHHYTMRPRAVELGSAQQIVETIRERMKGNDIFER